MHAAFGSFLFFAHSASLQLKTCVVATLASAWANREASPIAHGLATVATSAGWLNSSNEWEKSPLKKPAFFEEFEDVELFAYQPKMKKSANCSNVEGISAAHEMLIWRISDEFAENFEFNGHNPADISF